MQVTELKLCEIKPYKKNPRKNEEAVKYVAESIKQFGFKVPIVIDKNREIICGHTRYKAAEKLKLKTVPCILADDLTDEQIKAYRLADNKVSEKSEWNFDLLMPELEGLSFSNIDMSDFGFDFNFDDFKDDDEKNILEGEEYEEYEYEEEANERLRTDRTYNLRFSDLSRTEGFFQIPKLKNDGYIPKDIISFNYAKSTENKDIAVHFYVDDYQFERIWYNPMKYMDILMEFDGAFTPDFSLYMDMPMAMKIWNIYRSRLIGQIMQDFGMKVIPTISWAEKETFEFCFDGIEKGSVVSISTIGVKRDKEALKIWEAGVTEMIKRIEPKAILVYGGVVEYQYPEDIEVIYYENKVTERLKSISYGE